ncbi:Transcriptional regulator, MerR family, near polyamine transporter [Planococcus halocryophilus Or1]|uniref:Cro/Cl family transcriptional regulator n=1 Tax=Planococcus halocryophilus TaxID=1215089 RepID=A0A1C7DQ96_9BACL|nr:XRE family transcriptional regulator [Planococcus halocryophilus]ANU13686.1 Cro/Cl family transcriptional regulator [Planococcus halocryophilus]EMF46479.1 Transcriptional regulator, MerR family, near polyamine transporter [Planococcus halocryophilus Or1]
MNIGTKIKRLRLKNGLTQEELGKRTDLSKGFISQLERDMNSPSIETFFTLLEVLGTTPKEFFADEHNVKVVYSTADHTAHIDSIAGYEVEWLIPTSNEKEIEPVFLTLQSQGSFKKFEPSSAETFIYVLEGKVRLQIGEHSYTATTGDSIYYEASNHHQLINDHNGITEMIIVTTQSYL